MFANSKTLAIVFGALFLASMAIPTAAAEPPSDPGDIETGNDTVDCIVTHFFNGWFVGNCLHTTNSGTTDPGETLECVGEHLKNGWFVGNCLH